MNYQGYVPVCDDLSQVIALIGVEVDCLGWKPPEMQQFIQRQFQGTLAAKNIVKYPKKVYDMKTITRLGTFDDVLSKASPDMAMICRELRDVIEQLHPDCTEVPRPGEPSSAYGFGEKKMTEAYAYIMPQNNYVNLGFYHGVNITAKHKNLEGTGKSLRHIKIRTLSDAKSLAVKDILRDAMDERRLALGLTVG